MFAFLPYTYGTAYSHTHNSREDVIAESFPIEPESPSGELSSTR